MANLGVKNGIYLARFRFAGREHKKSLKTSDVGNARAAMHRVEDALHRLAIGLLTVPDRVDWKILASAASAVLRAYRQLRDTADAILSVVANTNQPAILPSSPPAEQKKHRQQTERLVESAVERMQEREKQQGLDVPGTDLQTASADAAAANTVSGVGEPNLDAAGSAAGYGPLGLGLEAQGAIAQHQPKPSAASG